MDPFATKGGGGGLSGIADIAPVIDSPLPNWPSLPTTGDLRKASLAVFNAWDKIAPGLPISDNVFDSYALIRSMVQQPVLTTQEARFEFLQQTHWHMRWSQFGFPTFELTQGLASALMLTEVRGLRGRDLHFPFDSFLLVLPNPSPIVFSDFDGHQLEVKWLYVHKMAVPNDREKLTAAHDHIEMAMRDHRSEHRVGAIKGARDIKTGYQTFVRLMSPAGLGIYDRDNWPEDEEPLERWLEVSALSHPNLDGASAPMVLMEADKAALRAATRLVVNLCCYINSLHGGLPAPDNQRKPTAKSSKKRDDAPPPPKHWILGREIKLSKHMHEMARAFSDRKKAKAAYRLHARFMVRGHMRNQVFGKGRSERRMQWIKPFWKGPETADGMARLYAVEPEEAKRGALGKARAGGAGSGAGGSGQGVLGHQPQPDGSGDPHAPGPDAAASAQAAAGEQAGAADGPVHSPGLETAGHG